MDTRASREASELAELGRSGGSLFPAEGATMASPRGVGEQLLAWATL